MDDRTTPLFVSRFGAGRPMVCLHGIEAHGTRFIGLAARLPGVDVIAPDLRGHGRSPRVGPWTVEQALDDLRPLVRELDQPPVLLGHSYGGFLAWRLAGIAPDRIGALILVDPAIAVSPELAAASQTPEASTVGRSWASELDAFAEMSEGRPADGRWAAALDVALAVERASDGRVRSVVAPEAVAAGWAQMTRPFVGNGYRGRTLLIEAGREAGRFVGPHVVAALRLQLGEALRHVVLDATHTIPSDYPDLLAGAIEEFLATL